MMPYDFHQGLVPGHGEGDHIDMSAIFRQRQTISGRRQVRDPHFNFGKPLWQHNRLLRLWGFAIGLFLRLVLIDQMIDIGLQDLVESTIFAAAIILGLSASFRITLDFFWGVVLLHYNHWRDRRIADWTTGKRKTITRVNETDGRLPGDQG